MSLSPEIQFSKRSQVHNDLLILINVPNVFQSGGLFCIRLMESSQSKQIKPDQRGIQSIPNTLFLTIMAQVSNENMLQTS